MLEYDLIQTRGFRNIYENGKAIGFEFNIRLTYYRGIFLSQLRPGSVKVDGKLYPKESIVWVLNGKEYTPAEMKALGDVNWDLLKPATLRVMQDGGLLQGYHDVETGYAFSSSYLPPKLQQNLDPDQEVRKGPPGFGPNRGKKRMLIV